MEKVGPMLPFKSFYVSFLSYDPYIIQKSAIFCNFVSQET